jgi:hypothetical protein
MDLITMKTSKGGRKISLPWFRQNSVQQSHAALSRQHTIDTPGSFRSYVGSKKLQVNLLNFYYSCFYISFAKLLILNLFPCIKSEKRLNLPQLIIIISG